MAGKTMPSLRPLRLAALVIATAATGWCDPPTTPPEGPTVRYFEHNGVTYREVREVHRRPVWGYEWESQTRTVYQPQRDVEQRTINRQVAVPRQRTVEQVRWHNRFNPLARPYPVRVKVPTVEYEWTTQQVTVPVESVRMVPVEQTVQVPVWREKLVDEPIVRHAAVPVTAVARQPPPSRASAGPDKVTKKLENRAVAASGQTTPNTQASATRPAAGNPQVAATGQGDLVPVQRPRDPYGRPAGAPAYYGFARPGSVPMMASQPGVPGPASRVAVDRDGWRASTQMARQPSPDGAQTQPARR